MAAPEGNSFYLLRSKHGRDKAYTPEALKNGCYEYFEECDNRPWYKNEAVKSGELAGELIKVPTERPYTKSGLYVFLGINRQTWENYKTDKDFLAIIEEIENIIYTQKFEGAAVGAFNANIIARDLGLADKSDNKNLNYNSADMTPEEMKDISKELDRYV